MILNFLRSFFRDEDLIISHWSREKAESYERQMFEREGRTRHFDWHRKLYKRVKAERRKATVVPMRKRA